MPQDGTKPSPTYKQLDALLPTLSGQQVILMRHSNRWWIEANSR